MEIEYTHQAIEDLNYWKKTNNTIILKKIRTLIESIEKNPFEGIGKPEQLKYQKADFWSRRINQEHRLVYFILGDTISIISFRGHYN